MPAGCQTNAWRMDPANPRTLFWALARIESLGFTGFETGFRFVAPQFPRAAEFRRELEETGLHFFGVHIFLEEYDPETGIAPWDLLTSVAAGAAALGAQWLILSGHAGGVEAVERKADALNRIAAHCAGLPIGLAYHSHDREFLDGAAEMEALVAATDPNLVCFVPDAGHAFRAGADFASFFARHHARIRGIHLRDFRAGEQVPLGQGEFDLQPLAREIRKAGWDGWLIGEEERSSGLKPGELAVGPAREHIRTTFGV